MHPDFPPELQGARGGGDAAAFTRVRVVELKRDGWTYGEIAREVGLGKTSVEGSSDLPLRQRGRPNAIWYSNGTTSRTRAWSTCTSG